MILRIVANASEKEKKFSLDLSDLDVTDEQWDKMSLDERQSLIQGEVDGFDQPYWQVSEISKK